MQLLACVTVVVHHAQIEVGVLTHDWFAIGHAYSLITIILYKSQVIGGIAVSFFQVAQSHLIIAVYHDGQPLFLCQEVASVIPACIIGHVVRRRVPVLLDYPKHCA